MQNLKYHLINIVAVLVFSYASASTINSIVKHQLTPTENKQKSTFNRSTVTTKNTSFEEYSSIISSGLFKVAAENDPNTKTTTTDSAGPVEDLELMATITGPWSIARAMIKKKGEKEPKIFALLRIDDEINNDVYGYKLIQIGESKVWIMRDNEKKMLDMYAQKTTENTNKPGGKTDAKTISRSVLQQQLKNLDEALKGIVAGPYRNGGKIEGYQLKRIRSYNILYKFGLRSGDIVRRVNGHSVDDTAKLYQMWQNLKSENNIKIDYTRRGNLQTIQFNITD